MKLIHNRIPFLAVTVFYILLQFCIGHVGLVSAYKTENQPLLFTIFVSLIIISIVFLIKQPPYRFFPLFTGVMIWSVLGEMSEHFGWFSLVTKNASYLLVLFLASAIFVLMKSSISQYLKVVVLLFSLIWTSHFIMITFFEHFGKIHSATFASAMIFVIALAYTVYLIVKTRDMYKLTLLSILLTCCSWSLLEYLWAWKWLTKPW